MPRRRPCLELSRGHRGGGGRRRAPPQHACAVPRGRSDAGCRDRLGGDAPRRHEPRAARADAAHGAGRHGWSRRTRHLCAGWRLRWALHGTAAIQARLGRRAAAAGDASRPAGALRLPADALRGRHRRRVVLGGDACPLPSRSPTRPRPHAHAHAQARALSLTPTPSPTRTPSPSRSRLPSPSSTPLSSLSTPNLARSRRPSPRCSRAAASSSCEARSQGWTLSQGWCA